MSDLLNWIDKDKKGILKQWEQLKAFSNDFRWYKLYDSYHDNGKLNVNFKDFKTVLKIELNLI